MDHPSSDSERDILEFPVGLPPPTPPQAKQIPPSTSLAGILGIALVLVAVLPFIPITWFAWNGYRAEVADIEREIQESNRHIAMFAVSHMDTMLRQLRRESSVAQLSGTEIPSTLHGAAWERIGGDCRITESQVASSRVGSPCEYRGLLDGETEISAVGRWVTEHPPTAVYVRHLGSGCEALAAVFDPEDLHNDLQSWAGTSLKRHVYAVDAFGQLLFYSDLEVSKRGDDLRANPPIRLFLDGGDGQVHYRSVVSGRERLGFVQRMSETDWGVIVSADEGSRLVAAHHRYRPLAFSIAFALAAALVILWLTSRRLVFPLLDIGRALRQPSRAPHAPLEVRARTRSVSEFEALVRAFDELSAELGAVERELVHAEKTSLLGQLASGLAHEMGTPLNIISGDAQYLLGKAADDDPSRSVLQQIVRQAGRITTMIRRLLDLSRPTDAQLVPLDPGAVVSHVLDVVPAIGKEIDVQVTAEPELPRVLADPRLLEHALLNLIVNACQAMPGGGSLTISASLDDAGGHIVPEVCLRVSDSGCGIPAEHLERVCEPFFSTKSPDQGTGLGLPIAERIVRQHGGRLVIESEPGKGTVVSIFLRTSSRGHNATPAPGRHPAETEEGEVTS